MKLRHDRIVARNFSLPRATRSSSVPRSQRKNSPVQRRGQRKAEEPRAVQNVSACTSDMWYSHTRLLARRNGVSADIRRSDSKLRYVASELQRRALLDFHSISSGIRSTFHPKRVRREGERKRAHKLPLSLPLSRGEGEVKKIEFQLDPRGEQGRFVRVNPFMAGAQWRDGNRSENKSKGARWKVKK